MAILNSLLRGQLKGRIGNQWFAHAKNSQGRPVTRTGTINSSPNNPQTYDQMLRRAKFANAVKFYKHAQQNFFKFAFENKKANETDYNAFMRLNIDNSMLIPKEFVDDANFPAFTSMLVIDSKVLSRDWLVTRGSLPRYMVLDSSNFYLESNNNDDTGLFISGQQSNSIGDLSSLFIQKLAAQPGDIVTIVVIGLPARWIYQEGEEVKFGHPETGPVWTTYQFIIDPTSTVNCTSISYSPKSGYAAVQDHNKGGICFMSSQGKGGLCSFITITRKEKKGLRAVNSKFLYYDDGDDLLRSYYQQHSEEEILDSWYATDQEILQGGVADPTGSGSNDSSSFTPTRLVANSSSFDSSKCSAGGSDAFKVYGSALADGDISNFTFTNCQGMTYQYVSGNYASMVVKWGSTAGACTIKFGDTTLFSGTVVTS